MTDQLSEFRSILSDATSLISWSVGSGAFAAIVGYFVGIAPPWPSTATPITCAAILLTVMYSFLRFRRTRGKIVADKFKKMLIATSLVFLSYVVVFSFFVFENPTTGKLLLKGFICSADAKSIYPNCPFLNEEAFAHVNYSPHLLWEIWTIFVIQILLFSIWIVLFCSFVNMIFFFVLNTKGQKAKTEIG